MPPPPPRARRRIRLTASGRSPLSHGPPRARPPRTTGSPKGAMPRLHFGGFQGLGAHACPPHSSALLRTPELACAHSCTCMSACMYRPACMRACKYGPDHSMHSCRRWVDKQTADPGSTPSIHSNVPPRELAPWHTIVGPHGGDPRWGQSMLNG